VLRERRSPTRLLREGYLSSEGPCEGLLQKSNRQLSCETQSQSLLLALSRNRYGTGGVLWDSFSLLRATDMRLESYEREGVPQDSCEWGSSLVRHSLARQSWERGIPLARTRASPTYLSLCPCARHICPFAHVQDISIPLPMCKTYLSLCPCARHICSFAHVQDTRVSYKTYESCETPCLSPARDTTRKSCRRRVCLAHGQRDRYVLHMGKGIDMSCTWAKGQICLAHGQRDRYVV